MERISLIDVSSEDDLLISSSTEGLPPMLQPLGSPEPKRGTSCKYNLRKSLAWDNAFFTSEGVLDPEELAVVNSTFKKTEVHVLPGIQEDTRKSNESSSTFESDSWALESLEVDLFENLRASIQKSQGKRNETSTMAHSNSTTASWNLDAQGSHSSRHVELSSQTKIKTPTASRRHDGGKQCLKQITEVAHAQVVKAAPEAVNQKSLLKPPRIASRIPTVPNKRISAPGSVQIKNIGKTLPGDVGSSQSNLASRKLNRGDTSSVTPRYSPSLRNCSGSPSSSRVLPAASSSSLVKSGSTPSNRTSKPQREVLRRKVDTRNIELSSDSADKVPLRIFKSKIGLKNSKISLNSTFKFYSSGSPNSSIDSMASESSSSSSSTARKPNSSTETLDVCRSSPRLLISSGSHQPPDMLKPENERSCIRLRTNETVVKSQHENQASPGNYVFNSSALDPSKNSINSNSGSRSFKPSCLRMPSPKIGYFDAEKSLLLNSNRCVPRGSQVPLNRNASKINNVGASKPKPSKLQSAIAVNCNFQQTGPQQISPSRERSIPPASVQVSETSLEVTGTPRAVENYRDRCSILHSFPGTNENMSEVEPGVTSEANEHEKQRHLSPESDMSCLNKKNGPVISGNGGSVGILSSEEEPGIGKEASVEHPSNLENKSFSTPKLNEKENLSLSASQVIELNRDMETKNLSAVMVELTGEKLSSLSLSDANDFDNASNLKLFPHPCDSIIQDMNILSVSPVNMGSRTPLVDDYCNRNGLINSGMESTVKSMDKTSSVLPFPAKGAWLHSLHGDSIPDAKKLVQENAISNVPYEVVFNTVRGSDTRSVS